MEGLIHGGAYFQNFTVIKSAFKFEPRFQPETKISFVANFLIDVVVLSAVHSQCKILDTCIKPTNRIKLFKKIKIGKNCTSRSQAVHV